MRYEQQQDLLYMLKALSDEKRLIMVGLMSEGERNVGELAQLLHLSEPTISHHLTKLRAGGLLRLRMDGNHRYYSLNPDKIAKLKAVIQEIDTPLIRDEVEESDNRWIDALDWSDEDKKVLRDCTHNGRFNHLPMKQKKLLVLLRLLATKFEDETHYTEKQVNAVIQAFHEDYATLRRYLVEFGFLGRDRGGKTYWLNSREPLFKIVDK